MPATSTPVCCLGDIWNLICLQFSMSMYPIEELIRDIYLNAINKSLMKRFSLECFKHCHVNTRRVGSANRTQTSVEFSASGRKDVTQELFLLSDPHLNWSINWNIISCFSLAEVELGRWQLVHRCLSTTANLQTLYLWQQQALISCLSLLQAQHPADMNILMLSLRWGVFGDNNYCSYINCSSWQTGSWTFLLAVCLVEVSRLLLGCKHKKISLQSI